jgi:hypothetical protein
MILEIISSHTNAITLRRKEKFLYNFEQLYQLPILHPILNLITSKAKNNLVEFIIEPQKNWDRLAGHCKTEGIFNKIGSFFSKNHKYKIFIKNINAEVIIHEIAHAIEKEIRIDLNQDFRKVLTLDFQNRNSQNIQMISGIETIMIKQLKGYNKSHIMSELFARYFELLAMSYEVNGWGQYQFYYQDIVGYFENTTKMIEKKFNNTINKKIDKEVLTWSKDLVKNLKPYKKQWAKDMEFQSNKARRQNTVGTGKWTGKTKSIGDWQRSWERFEELENKDKK